MYTECQAAARQLSVSTQNVELGVMGEDGRLRMGKGGVGGGGKAGAKCCLRNGRASSGLWGKAASEKRAACVAPFSVSRRQAAS